MRVVKWTASSLLILIILMILVIASDSIVEPDFRHPLLRSTSLGTHYFLNDVVGISPENERLPFGYVLSHSSRAAVIVSNENHGYRLAPADSYGLSQDPEIRGWGAVVDHNDSAARLNLQYLHSMIVGTVNEKNHDNLSRSLEISIPWPAIYGMSGNLEIDKQVTPESTKFIVTLHGLGAFWIETRPPPSDGFAIDIRLHGFSPGEVVVGAEQIKVTQNSFSLATRDMHSLAVTELDADAGIDISVVRGAVRGELEILDPGATDLLIDSDTNTEITSRYPGFLKRGCPGRQSSWVDIDSDNDLDLYIVCGRSDEPGKSFANQLYEQDGDRFTENGAKFGVDLAGYGTFRFIDWDRDRDPDLWWARSDGKLVLYKNENGHFQLFSIFSGSWAGDSRSPQLLVHDLESDGDPDILVIHPKGNRLLINDKGNAFLQELSLYGLPSKALAAHWADIDLNGTVDLLTASQGIYLDQGEREDLAYVKHPADISGLPFVYDARLVSFAGVDGRAFVFAFRRCLPGILCGGRRVLLSQLRALVKFPFDWLKSLKFLEPYDWFLQVSKRNLTDTSTHRELSVSLKGPEMNPYSIGARVDLAWGRHRESHWVGESDSALYSRGDLLIYSSAPKFEVVQIHATWQDGCEAVLSVNYGGAKNQVVKRPDSCVK